MAEEEMWLCLVMTPTRAVLQGLPHVPCPRGKGSIQPSYHDLVLIWTLVTEERVIHKSWQEGRARLKFPFLSQKVRHAKVFGTLICVKVMR
jgi:hypothetical protein